jgi:hypothetical protein
MTHVVFTLSDASDEKTSVTIPLPTLAADGSNYAAILTAITAAQAQVEAVTGGNVQKYTIVADIVRLTNVIPSDDSARETKWVVRYQDDTTLKIHTLEIGPADRSLLPMSPASDFVDTSSTDGTWTAFLSWFNGLTSPAGNNVTLLTMEHVGRSRL